MLVKRALLLLNAAFAIEILDSISHVHLPSFVNMLPKYLKDPTFSSCFWSINIFTGNGCLEILITYLLTPWSRVLLEKLTGLQLVKKFP